MYSVKSLGQMSAWMFIVILQMKAWVLKHAWKKKIT